MDESIPLLEHEYGDSRNAMSRKLTKDDGSPLPSLCVMSFMRDALERFVESERCVRVSVYHSETRDFPIYETSYLGRQVCMVQSPVGAPAAAILADLLIDSGVESIVACGGCGVLEPIESGRVLVPTSALRDEGTSFHYIPPAREIALDESAVATALGTLDELGIRHQTCMVWTCDAFFRETPNMVRLRKEQGCSAVDMECAALAAVAEAYGATFASLLYSGDTLADPDNHDERDWIANSSARDVTFRVALEVLVRI